MSQCIYCNIHFSQRELCDEHVISASLGVREVLRSSTCRDCNSGLGNSIEAYLANELECFRNLMQVKNRDGQVPSVSQIIEQWGKRVRVTVDGERKLRFEHPVDLGFDVDDDGNVWRTFRVPADDKEQLEELERNFRKKHPNGHSEIVRHSHQDVIIGFEFDFKFVRNRATRRCVSKYAYCFLAQFRGIDFALKPEFDGVRQFILGQDSEAESIAHIVYHQHVFRRLNISIPNHAVLLCADNQQGHFFAIVVIFGMFYYLVELASNYEGPDWFELREFDPIRGKSYPLPVLPRTFFTHIPVKDIVRGESVNTEVWLGAVKHAVKKYNKFINPGLVELIEY
ncbi:MAG: hypothetical protein IH975_06455 [Nitrospinae bacterium]|nr:hypothetical protein [Nitrospinota bacterium]